MRRSASTRGGTVQSPPGERNRLRATGPGASAAVIAPWNFPLAIPTGMVTAALAAGNAVCFKPAEQTPAIASAPGGGAGGRRPAAGRALASSPGAARSSAPTWSSTSGRGGRSRSPARGRWACRSSGRGCRRRRAAPDQAGHHRARRQEPDHRRRRRRSGRGGAGRSPPARSRFAGQKCSAASRLIVHRAVYEPIVERLVGAHRALELGHPQDPGGRHRPGHRRGRARAGCCRCNEMPPAGSACARGGTRSPTAAGTSGR